MDIMKAKVCRNNNYIFWTMWDEFNPYNEEHHHGEVDLVSETDQNDIEYAREEKYDEAIFIESTDTVVIHDIKSWYTNRCSISDVCYHEI